VGLRIGRKKNNMEEQTPVQTVRFDDRGFGLLEILIVVAIIALIASMAIPAFQNAMLKSKRNAAVSDLRVFKDAMSRYYIDMGRFPTSGEFNLSTLAPLDRAHMQNAKKVLNLMQGKKLDFYFPWNIFADDLDIMSFSTNPQSYFIIATLDYRRDIRFIVTDSDLYYYIDYSMIPVSEY
jgi:prepilin-type N-terminal cleavage/methylation domain-containing protein